MGCRRHGSGCILPVSLPRNGGFDRSTAVGVRKLRRPGIPEVQSRALGPADQLQPQALLPRWQQREVSKLLESAPVVGLLLDCYVCAECECSCYQSLLQTEI